MRTIGDWLICEETGRPFSHCVRCRLPLLEIDEPWLVNKEFARHECVLEYGICRPCRDAVTAEFCEASKRSVREFLENAIDWEARSQEMILARDPVEHLDACIACRTPRGDIGEFDISALFDADGLQIGGPLPLLICRSCVNRMTAGLSEESRRVWQKFLADHFDGPPGEPGLTGLL